MANEVNPREVIKIGPTALVSGGQVADVQAAQGRIEGETANQAQRMDRQEPRLVVPVMRRRPALPVPRFLGKSARGEDLRGADLSGQDLRNIDFSFADLCGANLAKADLRGCRFYRTRLDGCNLSGRVIDDRAIDSTCQPVPRPLLVPCSRS